MSSTKTGGTDDLQVVADPSLVAPRTETQPGEQPPPARTARARPRQEKAQRQRRERPERRVLIPLLWLNTVIALVLAVGPLLHEVAETPSPAGDARGVALAAFVVWSLAFLPGWLFVRFLDRRAASLWDEFVVHLHRLGLDEPGRLPEPPGSSSYHAKWESSGGREHHDARNLYREKFDAYYGRSVSRFGTQVRQPVATEALFPVFLVTALLAVGWTTILYDPQAALGDRTDPTLFTALCFCFVGSYVFFLQMLLRRYFQTDLRAGAYVAGYIRVVVSLLVVVIIYVPLARIGSDELLLIVAFMVGFFPLAGIQYLTRKASRVLRGQVPSVVPAYPLNRLDGLNVWYEARLLEEGIEDLQNLLTAKIVDVILHTRVPVGRLVDWIDQALLLVHLPAEAMESDQAGLSQSKKSREAAKQSTKHPRYALRSCGIRSASSLVRALHGLSSFERDDLLERIAAKAEHWDATSVLSLHRVLASDRRLGAIYNWQGDDAPARDPLPHAELGPQPATQSQV